MKSLLIEFILLEFKFELFEKFDFILANFKLLIFFFIGYKTELCLISVLINFFDVVLFSTFLLIIKFKFESVSIIL